MKSWHREMPEGLYYVLKDHEVVPAKDLFEWAYFFEKPDRLLFHNMLFKDRVRVSTVFIGIYENLFETMIFGGKYNGEQWRCDTWEQAEAQHVHAITVARGKAKP